MQENFNGFKNEDVEMAESKQDAYSHIIEIFNTKKSNYQNIELMIWVVFYLRICAHLYISDRISFNKVRKNPGEVLYKSVLVPNLKMKLLRFQSGEMPSKTSTQISQPQQPSTSKNELIEIKIQKDSKKSKINFISFKKRLLNRYLCTCEICNEKFDSKKINQIHKRKKHDQFDCPKCGITFWNLFDVLQHYNSHILFK